ncbi:unnamed protein product [Cuscuta campestris]|uniref:Uncharacterized protein n=1 Tax=Cuscuta campestris TaxID=132261 RepID=A0A484LXE7_9ASTE|nr:unnamed protein product [Cuscuta campestris]
MRDRISELPDDVLDHILGLLPIHEAAGTAVLSTVWRDVWLSLSHLNFDQTFFIYIRNHYVAEASFLVVNKVLMKHMGPVRKFVFDFGFWRSCDRFRFPDFDQWLLLFTQNGVEEVFLSFGNGSAYILPDCMFSCQTLKKLHLKGVFVEPINAPCIFPNVVSLHLENARFGTPNHVGCSAVNLPMLECLACKRISDFNITAPKLKRLQIIPWTESPILPLKLSLKPIRHLQLGTICLKSFAKELSRLGQDGTALNVEHLELQFCPRKDKEISAFIHLVRMCPKLCKLDVKCHGAESTSIEALLKHRDDSVAQTCKGVRALNVFCSFRGSMPEMQFFEWLVTRFPTLEKIVVFQTKRYCPNTELKNKRKFLRFLRSSSNAKMDYIHL